TTRAKVHTRMADMLRLAQLGALTARVDGYEGALGPLKRTYDQSLRLIPFPAEERCDSAVCRRVSFMYGRLYQHDQLDVATHATLHELFGVASTTALEHLATIIRHGHVVAADGEDRYVPRLERMGIPLTFIHGERNVCFLPASTAATVAALSAVHGPERFERHLVPNYGHIDCIFGKNAATDVYPLMLLHFDRVDA